jgi:hypothetical protein
MHKLIVFIVYIDLSIGIGACLGVLILAALETSLVTTPPDVPY